MFNYKPLWKQLVDKDMSKTALREKANFTTVTLAKMNKNEFISMEVLDRICKTLECNIEDVIRYENELYK